MFINKTKEFDNDGKVDILRYDSRRNNYCHSVYHVLGIDYDAVMAAHYLSVQNSVLSICWAFVY